MHNPLINHTCKAFQSAFQSEPEHFFLSPGRINILGEHVDYNDGFVLPAAIDKYICFAVKKKQDTETCTLVAIDIEESFSFNINEQQSPVEKAWANYLLGVVEAIQKNGKTIGGLQVAFSSTIPMGSGLSSSAALECGFAYILNALFDLQLSKKEIALIGQKAEHTFVGVQCGIMDQFATVFGKENKVMILDCNSLEHRYYDARLEGYRLVLFDSCVKHTHLTSGYNDRRKDVEQGKQIIRSHYPEMTNFRDVTEEILIELKKEMGEVVYRRCLYLVKEIRRVGEAVQALSENRPEDLGHLMTETHTGLSKEYEVSCNEIDFLVEETLTEEGVLGARMMGGGFGGCSINLLREDQADRISKTIEKKYREAFGIQMKVYNVNISEGIKEYTANAFII
ncbi:galactokinase [Chryseobacterium sp. SSA4.19]|uniref:galactokinase n=1 Tax=Chryseobacterium sp. SSA4.19 TaxID=2919915 RepID=UPI001F4E834F|nr:galactokinase [Chryseobacterium sp. SSA4.19]MCJ8152672.1 galactokinase [Chryseobacterium sp. SSA4.19]